jgi:hypothetical protein
MLPTLMGVEPEFPNQPSFYHCHHVVSLIQLLCYAILMGVDGLTARTFLQLLDEFFFWEILL